jgi:uncharacterized small protein (DUF1192 family)
MAKRQIDLAIANLDQDIAVLQAARERLVKQRDEQDAKRKPKGSAALESKA